MPLRHPAQLGADRAPAVRLHLALLQRHGRHEQLLDADRAGLLEHPVRPRAQVGHADMARGRGEPVGVEPGTGAGGIGEMAADRLDLAEAELSQGLELPVEIADTRAGCRAGSRDPRPRSCRSSAC